jgi:hypothetical protein
VIAPMRALDRRAYGAVVAQEFFPPDPVEQDARIRAHAERVAREEPLAYAKVDAEAKAAWDQFITRKRNPNARPRSPGQPSPPPTVSRHMVYSNIGGPWKSAVIAARELGTSLSNIRNAIHCRYRCVGRFFWRSGPTPTISTIGRRTAVRRDDGVVFYNRTLAMKAAGALPSTKEHNRITRAMRKGLPYRGHVYQFCGANPPVGKVTPGVLDNLHEVAMAI